MAAVWLRRPSSGLWRRHSDALNVRLLDRWLPGPVGPVLKTDLFDEAVSEGLFPALRARATHVTAVDINADIAAAAGARHPDLETLVADVRSLPFDDAAFDAVVSNSTLDHFDDEDQIRVAIAELARVLRPGGRLVLTLDNPLNPFLAVAKALPRAALNRGWRSVGREAARVGLAPYYVGATLGRRAMRDAVRAARLEPRETGTLVHSPRVLAVVVAAGLERRTVRTQDTYLRILDAFEALACTPLRTFTAHLNAILAVKPDSRA